MPSPRELSYWSCDECYTSIYNEDELYTCERVNWHVPGAPHHCSNDTVCVGCTYDCADCERTICKSCTVKTPLGDGFSTYRCIPCEAIYLQQERRDAA
jgi:hypothetical protein